MPENLITTYRKRTKIIAIVDMVMRGIMLYIVFGALHSFALVAKHNFSKQGFLQEWRIEYLQLIVMFFLAAIVVILYVFEILAVIKLWRCVKAVSVSQVTSLTNFWKTTAIFATIFYVLITVLVVNFSSMSEFKPEYFTDILEISTYVLEVAIKLVGYVIVTNFITQLTTTLTQNPWEGVELNGVRRIEGRSVDRDERGQDRFLKI